jgi:hypothetical protein
VRNLIGALIAACAGLAGGAGGAAAIKGDVPPEVRSALEQINNTLVRIETRDEGRVKDAAKLESRVDQLEADVHAIERKVGK